MKPPVSLLPLLPLLPLLLTLVLAMPGDAAYAASAQATAASRAAQSAQSAKSKAVQAAKAKQAAAPARPAVDYAGDDIHIGEWQAVRDFEDDLVNRQGFTREALDGVFARTRFINTAVELMKPAPPGKPKNWQTYSARFIEPVRIRAGVNFWNDNADTLARAEATYGVPAEIIVGILGIETIYGRDTGRFRVVDVLATLAFAYPETPNRAERMAFFRNELENTLLLARQTGIEPFSLQGSFAGAVGMPQFMPGNILKYGVDFDGDGTIDLRNSPADAIGSVANFLIQHGWDRNATGPAVFAADVSPAQAWQGLIGGLEARYRPDVLHDAGVTTASALMPDRDYGLVDLQNGADPTAYWVANGNFFAITKYNRSYFYAMSVIDLGRAISRARSSGT